jgi:predicted metal-binding protein
MQHTLFVCTTCASVWENGKRVGESGGDRLLQQLQLVYQNWDLRTEFTIQPVACMSACDRACVISFAAPGKHTYLFGDLAHDLASPNLAIDAILTCATKYLAQPQGLLPWADRPEPLKKGILAKIPPYSYSSASEGFA